MDMDLFLLNKLQQLKDGGSSSSGGSGASFLDNTDALTTTDRLKPIATVVGTNNRGSGPGYNWSSNLPEGTFYVRMDNSESQHWGFFAPRQKVDMDSGGSGAYYNTNTNMQDNENYSGIEWASDDFIGHPIMSPSQNWSSSYTPFISRIMFLRNTNNTSTSCNVDSYYSSYWSSGYDGTCLMLYTPNSQNFTDVTDISMSRRWEYTNNTWINNTGTTFTIPARTTVAVILYNSVGQWTSFSNGNWLYHFNGFYNLRNTFTNGIECDLRATEAYAKMSDNSMQDNVGNNSNIVKFFNNVGRMYGNWEYA